MNTGKVRIFIQPLGQRGGAYEVAQVRNTSAAVSAAVQPLLGTFDVGYYAVRTSRVSRPPVLVGGGR